MSINIIDLYERVQELLGTGRLWIRHDHNLNCWHFEWALPGQSWRTNYALSDNQLKHPDGALEDMAMSITKRLVHTQKEAELRMTQLGLG